MSSFSLIKTLQANIGQVIKGKDEIIELAVTTLLARGHLLIEDVPGVGKTTLAQALARSLSCSFRRVQFTSDLLPSDIIGVTIFNQQTQTFEFKQGPLFANIVLADEINRTTPKTQSSLLEAMNEMQVSVDNRTYPLPRPFMVMATQNPMEYHGTYPLPESQLDRFLMRIRMGYPDEAHEREILSRPHLSHPASMLNPVLTIDELIGLQEKIDRIRIDDSLVDYLLAIVRATRQTDQLQLGASPRGAILLYRAAQAHAFVQGRDYCLPDDIKRLAAPVLAHRLIVSSRIEPGPSGDREAERVLEELLSAIPVPL
ncbi:MAG: MoxR family ATPase [Nitrospirota bacterium]